MLRRDPKNLAVSIDDAAATETSAIPTRSQFERDSPHAWRMVAAGFIAAFTLFGVVYSFGAFFKPTAGRLGLGPLADRFGLIATYRFCLLVLGLCFVIWLTENPTGCWWRSRW
jgi:hypothetical protein